VTVFRTVEDSVVRAFGPLLVVQNFGLGRFGSGENGLKGISIEGIKGVDKLISKIEVIEGTVGRFFTAN
jgi:hypothetical protein